MARRTADEQALHDRVISDAGRIVNQLGIEVKLVGFVEGEDGSIVFDQEIIPPL